MLYLIRRSILSYLISDNRYLSWTEEFSASMAESDPKLAEYLNDLIYEAHREKGLGPRVSTPKLVFLGKWPGDV